MTPGIPPKRNQRPTDDVEAAPERKDKSDTYQCIRPNHVLQPGTERTVLPEPHTASTFGPQGRQTPATRRLQRQSW